MSCGEPHETDCSEVLAEVWLFLDHECDKKRRQLLEHHLDECSPCLEQFGIDEHLKVLLARKCGGEHASGGPQAATPGQDQENRRRSGRRDGAG